MIATLLSASVGVPYVVSQQSGNKAATEATSPASGSTHPSSAWPSTASGPPALPSTTTAPHSYGPPSSQAVVQSTSPPLMSAAGAPTPVRVHPVEQVLRFDLTRDWVYQNWDRKTTGPTDVGLFAVRVALVSGTDISSLAGSLTYFFNLQGTIEHISFRGRTGDTRRLIDFLTRTYLFEAVSAPTGELIYQVQRSGKVQSEFRARPEPVLRSATPHGNIAVELELARPGTNRFLPPRGPNLQLPQVTSAPTAPTTDGAGGADGGEGSSAAGAIESYFDKARYATPDEQGHVLWKRWPN